MSNYKATKTLWQLLSEQRVEIPIIQRDYAQGRRGNEYLRERFISGLFGAIKNNTALNLDFVYGTVENDALWPLDGQQRLTTLWLFHWFIALQAGKLAEAKDVLKRFTYETRISSREFCEHLCDIDCDDFEASELGVREYIENQTWYYNRFTQDPTIQGMLTTLAGNDVKRGDGDKDIIDGLEEYYTENSLAKEDALNYWALLESDDCPIRFYYRDMKDDEMPLSDDLYIKMNARGRQLTDFENFKADVIGVTKDGERLVTVDEAALFDNQWTDVFWNEAVEAESFDIDNIFFAFMRRYFLCHYIATSEKNVDDMKKDDFYKHIYKTTEYKYQSIKPYLPVLTREMIESLKTFFDGWTANGHQVSLTPAWGEDKNPFAFIPKNINGQPSSITLTQRVKFYAVCRFFELNSVFNKVAFGNWIRVINNLLVDEEYDEDAMIRMTRVVHELSNHSDDILSFLASDEKLNAKYSSEQFAEERFKAKLLSGENADAWRELVLKAEGNDFLRGNIACILRKDTAELVDDIELAKRKLSRIELYFDAQGVKKEYQLPLTKALFRCIHSWEQIKASVSTRNHIFDTSRSSWKWFIMSPSTENDYLKEVDTLLSAETLDSIEYISLNTDDSERRRSYDKIKALLALDTLANEKNVCNSSKWRICWSYDSYNLYEFNGRTAYRLDYSNNEENYCYRRNELLLNTLGIVIEHPSRDKSFCDKVLNGWTITFSYDGVYYQWHTGDKIKVSKDVTFKTCAKAKNGKDFDAKLNETSDMTAEAFLARLKEIAAEAFGTNS